MEYFHYLSAKEIMNKWNICRKLQDQDFWSRKSRMGLGKDKL